MKNAGIYLMFAAIVGAAVYIEPTMKGLISGVIFGAFCTIVVEGLVS